MVVNKTPKWFIDKIIAPACDNDNDIIDAFMKVPRSMFVDVAMSSQSYDDNALPIGFGQTISQPTTVAKMLKLLELQKSDRVLEIGSGSGFVTALLSCIVKQVYAIERLVPLFEKTRNQLLKMNIRNVLFSCSDGVLGWKEYAPYDKIIVSAGAEKLPVALSEQVSDGGIIVIPIKNRLIKFKKDGDNFIKEDNMEVKFVDFVGS